MLSHPLLTIGYEGLTSAEFIGALNSARVEVLVDVRAIAHSRRSGFAKTALRASLETAGITYLHMPALGNPKPGREAAWAGREAEYHRIFLGHLAQGPAQVALDEVTEVARRSRSCLMCMEAEPERCHRSMVAAELARRIGFRIADLHPLSQAKARVA